MLVTIRVCTHTHRIVTYIFNYMLKSNAIARAVYSQVRNCSQKPNMPARHNYHSQPSCVLDYYTEEWWPNYDDVNNYL